MAAPSGAGTGLLGWMVVAVRPSYREPGAFEYASAGSIGTREAAENHRAYCQMSAEDEPARYGDVRYVVTAVEGFGSDA